ncbi:MAG: gamma-glutamyltransferase [Acidimicrobiia bacterium]|nr:gamma-glutamyltransferase [Acidimicrobiia bacterium]
MISSLTTGADGVEGIGVVAAGHPLTVKAAADVLVDGGNAIDAALAAMAMACVCEPVLASIGGGGFAMVRRPGDEAPTLIDFFPQTPRRRRQPAEQGTQTIHANFGAATQAFRIGPGTVATPGFPAGIGALQRFGSSRPLIDLFGPAISSATDGVEITDFQHFLFTVVAPILTATEEARSLFAPDGPMLAPGSRLLNPGLANALTILASSSSVDNPVMGAILEAQAADGNLTADDLTHYEATVRPPLTVKVGRALVHLNPFPAAGGVLVEHSLKQLSSADPLNIAEAFRATAKARAAATDDLGRLDPALLRTEGTTHISVIDDEGTACAVTISNGAGNGEIVDHFGFMLNNILGEDDLNPLGPGVWPTDTRLSSMMCPTIVEQADGGLVAMGTGGSNRIRTAITQVVAQLCLNDADLVSAVDAPRLHVEGDHLDFEDQLGDEVRAELCARFDDHLAWPEPDLFYGGVHAVQRRADGRLVGHGDGRRDGAAAVID